MAEENKRRSINVFFQAIAYFPLLIFFLMIVVDVPLFIVYLNGQNFAFLLALIIFTAVLAVLYIAFAIYALRHFRSVFVRGLYGITIYNLRNITDNSNALIDYPNNTYDEFVSLNEQVNALKSELDTSTLIAGNANFSHINLDYIDVDQNLTTFRSFKINLESIIFASQNYRNVIIELYYDLGEEILSNKDLNYLLTLLRKQFADYRDVLYIFADNKKSIYVYLPRIDSLSKIQEQLEMILKAATISKRSADGITHLIAHFALVCYPFSDINDLLPDLQYAKRQGEIINVYLPNRMTTLQDNKILKNSMNLNTMSKIIAPLLDLNLSLENSKKNRLEVEKVIRAVRSYFNVDYAGIISFDEIKRQYYFSYQTEGKDLPILSKENFIEKEFVLAMNKAKDDNGSYYFAFRSHANNALGRHLDRVGIASGFFYVLNEGDNTVGAVYFFNKEKEFHIDSYIQESLVMLCVRIAAVLLGEKRDLEVSDSYNEIDSLLKISETATYRVAHDNYTLLRTSKTMNDIFPKLTIGEKCYEALYGLKEPCPDCPLLAGKKKTVRLNNNNYEVSSILESRKSSPYHVLTMRNIHQEEGQERYHPDLIINSYSSLVEALNNCYTINGKGYLLLLRVDNLDDLVASNGSEGYLLIMRDFIRRIKAAHNSLENVYFFNNQTLALLFTEYGQTDIINECETIYEISQNKDVKEAMDYAISVTYLPVSYPRTYPTANDLLRQAGQFATRGKYELNKNFIYFDESSYNRSASKSEFMLSVIESAFGNKTFAVNLQPMVDAKSKRIFGAELLLRITDEYRNMVFRTDELVNVAAEHNKIGIISNALLEYIANLYQQYSLTVFNVLGFQRLSINTDYSFFTDENFYNEIRTYVSDSHLPRNFLAFEVPENDVANHLNEFKEIAQRLNDLHIVMVVDQYTGRFVSLDALKKIGFNEVKISRNLVNHIDSDRSRLNDIRLLLNAIKDLDMKASLVGVENVDQYLLLKEIDENSLMQGFYFFRPLEKQGLIEAIRGANKAGKKD